MHYCNPAYPGTTKLSDTDKIAVKIYYGNMPSVLSPPGHSGYVGYGLRIIIIPTLIVDGTPYRFKLKQKAQDLNPVDGIYDNVYEVTERIWIPGSNSTNPARFVRNSVINKLTVPLFKRVVNNVETNNANNGRVAYLGYAEMEQNPGGSFSFTATDNTLSISWQ